MRARIAIFLITLMASTFALAAAEDPDYVTESDTHLIFGLPDSTTRENSLVTAWTEWREFDNTETGQKGRVTLKLYVINCKARRSALRAATEYADASKKKITSDIQLDPIDKDFEDIRPGTVSESIMKWACEKKLSKSRSK